MNRTVTEQMISGFGEYLKEQERSENTVRKYLRDIRALAGYIGNLPIDKTLLVGYKSELERKYAPASVNSMLAAVNCFLEYIGRTDLRIKPLKIQKSLFADREKELNKDEYIRIVQAAKESGNERLTLIVETICSTGIRVSELKYITVEAVYSGRAEINCKGKHRTVFLPETLCRLLKSYINKRKITSGAVFVTRNGNPVDRSNIWRDMKKLCESAGVARKKAFPHNLRHLFARTFYSIEKDISRLADILGHSSINTTRIYTMESGFDHIRQLEMMCLVI